MRGDNYVRTVSPSCGTGSPPHARGQHPRYRVRPRCLRFTPACAGTTRSRLATRSDTTVHPRMRGDNVGEQPRAVADGGSPPHARGQRSQELTCPRRQRFTPACAGTTARRSSASPRVTVHPRMRGDNRPDLRYADPERGSPPHARGQLGQALVPVAVRRFTPACAGTTSTNP